MQPNFYYNAEADAHVELKFPRQLMERQPVTVRASGYFFVPSMAALAMLADAA